jgi:hypothetical protein
MGSFNEGFSHLKCTLTGFERNSGFSPFFFIKGQNYQVKILSELASVSVLHTEMNQINKLKYHTTVEVSQSQKKINLNPNFVTGFADGESSFIILILREPKNKTG